MPGGYPLQASVEVGWYCCAAGFALETSLRKSSDMASEGARRAREAMSRVHQSLFAYRTEWGGAGPDSDESVRTSESALKLADRNTAIR